MATHSSTLAWKIPWMEEPGRLQSMGLQRVRHDLITGQQSSCLQCVDSSYIILLYLKKIYAKGISFLL